MFPISFCIFSSLVQLLFVELGLWTTVTSCQPSRFLPTNLSPTSGNFLSDDNLFCWQHVVVSSLSTMTISFTLHQMARMNQGLKTARTNQGLQTARKHPHATAYPLMPWNLNTLWRKETNMISSDLQQFHNLSWLLLCLVCDFFLLFFSASGWSSMADFIFLFMISCTFCFIMFYLPCTWFLLPHGFWFVNYARLSMTVPLLILVEFSFFIIILKGIFVFYHFKCRY